MQLDREVAVGVPDGPQRDEMADEQARLLPKLPSSGGLRPFARFDVAARKLPETR